MSAPWFDAPAPLLPDILALHGRWLGNKPAIICDDETLSWRALCDALCRFANGLHAAGLKPGDRVAVLMDNTPEMMVALFGIIQAGCVTVPLNLMVADEALAVMVRDADAIGVVASASQAPRLETLRREALSEEWPLGTGPWLCHGKTPEGWADFRTWLAGQSAEVPSVTLDDGDECNIIYSSGTTGKPKGIVHTHRRRLDWFRDLALALRYDRATVNLCAIGLFSNISWAGMGCTLLCGGTVVIMRQFDADQWLTAVARHGVTHSAMVPVQFQRILGSPAFGDADLASIKSLMCCGSPLEAELKARILETLNPQLVELYGLTEGLITTLEPEDAADRLASVGKPLVGIDLLILDDQDTPCPPGTPGEIVGRGPHLMTGYHDRDDANREATWTDPQGHRWLRTGDIGRLDEAGFLFLVDRKKDMIISGGMNLYPADLEAVIARHPGVEEVAVIGVDSDRWGESPFAVLVGPPEPEAVVAWTNDRVGKHQRLAGATRVHALPRNPAGKVLKRELRTRYRDWLNRPGTQPENP